MWPQQILCKHCGILSPRTSTTRVTVRAAAPPQVGHLHAQHPDEGTEVAAAAGVEPRVTHGYKLVIVQGVGQSGAVCAGSGPFKGLVLTQTVRG